MSGCLGVIIDYSSKTSQIVLMLAGLYALYISYNQLRITKKNTELNIRNTELNIAKNEIDIFSRLDDKEKIFY